jgi:hypothetical protein
MTPNVKGNRRAALALVEDQGMNRRVRLTIGLGATRLWIRRLQCLLNRSDPLGKPKAE